MIQVNTSEAKNKLSYLLSKVEKDHEEIQICRNGKPVALLVPLEEPCDPLIQNPKLSKVVLHEDATAPLDEDDWPCDFR